MAVEHSNLIKKTLLALSTLPRTRAWQNDTGIGRSMDGQRIIKFGLKGSSDILGISKSRFIAIEIKIGKDKQREEQLAFQKMIEMCGGLYFLIRDQKDLDEMINSL